MLRARDYGCKITIGRGEQFFRANKATIEKETKWNEKRVRSGEVSKRERIDK